MVMVLVIYGLVFTGVWLLLTVGAIRLRRHPLSRDHRAVWIVLAVALVARLAVVFSLSPALSDDIGRYLYDGDTLANGKNPYVLSPKDTGIETSQINHAHLVTIYQPTSQYVFAALATVGSNDRVFRLGFVAFDMMTIALLLVALQSAGRSPWWSTMYAWHPLAVTEIAWSGHQDAVGLALLVAMLICVDRAKDRITWAWLGGLAFALCLAVKPIVAPLALPIAWQLRQQWRAVAAGILATILGLTLLYLPFILSEGGLGGMIDTIRTFMDKWAFNASVHGGLEAILGEKVLADRTAGALLILVLGVATFTTKNIWQAAMAYLLAAVLLSSTVHPWYLLWVVVLLPMAWCWTGWVFSAFVVLCYTAQLNTREFQPWFGSWVVEYVVVYGVLLIEVVRRKPGIS